MIVRYPVLSCLMIHFESGKIYSIVGNNESGTSTSERSLSFMTSDADRSIDSPYARLTGLRSDVWE